MSGNGLLPWLNEPLDQLLAQRDGLAHAYLFTGQPGLGKSMFALQFARAMLCSQPTPHACGKCHACHLFDTGSHPDLHVLQSDLYTAEHPGLLSDYAARYPKPDGGKSKKPSAIIATDQVRNVLPDINARPHMATCRVIILHPAEDLFVNAANSLLKALEEPPPDTHFILISHDPGRLLPTLRSRCNRIDFRLPDKASVQDWLTEITGNPDEAASMVEQAHGIPLRALALANGAVTDGEQQLAAILAKLSDATINPVVATAGIMKSENFDLRHFIELLQRLISALIRDRYRTPASTSHLHEIANRLNSKVLFEFLDDTYVAARQASTTVDQGLILEDLLARWQELYSSRYDQRTTG